MKKKISYTQLTFFAEIDLSAEYLAKNPSLLLLSPSEPPADIPSEEKQ